MDNIETIPTQSPQTSEMIAATDPAEDALIGERPDGRYKLTYKDVALVLNLHDAGKSQASIAQMFDISQGQVSKILNGFSDSREAARRRLKASAMKLVRHAMKASAIAAQRGDADPALEMLDRLDVAPKRQAVVAGTGPKVMIVVGGSNPAALPTIDVGALSGSQGSVPLSTALPAGSPDNV